MIVFDFSAILAKLERREQTDDKTAAAAFAITKGETVTITVQSSCVHLDSFTRTRAQIQRAFR